MHAPTLVATVLLIAGKALSQEAGPINAGTSPALARDLEKPNDAAIAARSEDKVLRNEDYIVEAPKIHARSLKNPFGPVRRDVPTAVTRVGDAPAPAGRGGGYMATTAPANP